MILDKDREKFNFDLNLIEYDTNRDVLNNVVYNGYHGVMDGYFKNDETRWSVWTLKKEGRWGIQHGTEINFKYK